MIKLKSLLEATKIRGANNKMVEVPKSYVDKTGKFAYRFYRTPGMGGDLTSGLEFGYRRYHKIPPNDEHHFAFAASGM